MYTQSGEIKRSIRGCMFSYAEIMTMMEGENLLFAAF
jgi:hypothetical protein